MLQFLNMFLWLLLVLVKSICLSDEVQKTDIAKKTPEFQQVKIKDLNDENNVEMFTSSVRGRKAFAAEQKIRELKTRIATLSAPKLKITPTKIMQNSPLNTNTMKSEKYGLSPEEIEGGSLAGERFKTIFNMHRIEKTI